MMQTAANPAAPAQRHLEVQAVRADFPILARTVRGRPLVYLDTSATAQKPLAVLDAMDRYYRTCNANVHRGVHTLSQEATDAYEGARSKMRRFINAREDKEVIFTRGATEAINLVAKCYAGERLREGDEILLTNLEHHSNIVPWQMVREATGAVIRVLPVNDRGELVLDKLDQLLTEKTKIVACVHVSNALGTINPVEEIAQRAHEAGAKVVIDGAQAAPHLDLDMQRIGADFYAISGHKMYGPTGVGVLYGRRDLLEAMPPWLGGGDMIKSVTFEKTIYNDLPNRFEAGTPNIAGVIGLGAAAEYLKSIGLDRIGAHEHDLLEYATEQLSAIDNLQIIGTAAKKGAVVSFTYGEVHPHDIGTILDHEGIAIRTGHHCTQPLMERFGVTATARASFGMYNTREEIDRLVEGIHKVREVFSA